MSDLSCWQAPEGLNVAVYLIEQVFDNDTVLSFGKSKPFVEIRWGIASSSFAIGRGSTRERMGLFC